jgi:hypothetical protein
MLGGRAGLFYGLIEWGFLMLIRMLARSSVPHMPVQWRAHMVEAMNARSEADRYRKDNERTELENEAHERGIVLGNSTSWR